MSDSYLQSCRKDCVELNGCNTRLYASLAGNVILLLVVVLLTTLNIFSGPSDQVIKAEVSTLKAQLETLLVKTPADVDAKLDQLRADLDELLATRPADVRRDVQELRKIVEGLADKMND